MSVSYKKCGQIMHTKCDERKDGRTGVKQNDAPTTSSRGRDKNARIILMKFTQKVNFLLSFSGGLKRGL